MDDQTGAPRHLIRGRNAVPFPVGRKGGVQLGDLTGLLAKIRPAVEATHCTGERSAKNYAFRRRCGAKECVTDYRQHSGKEPCSSGPRIQRQHKDCRLDVQLETGVAEFLDE
jgi:carbonic anhydrase